LCKSFICEEQNAELQRVSEGCMRDKRPARISKAAAGGPRDSRYRSFQSTAHPYSFTNDPQQNMRLTLNRLEQIIGVCVCGKSG